MVSGNTREAGGNGGKKAARHERAGAGRGWIPQQEKQAQQWQFKSEILASGNTRGSCQWQQRIIRWQWRQLEILGSGNKRGVGRVGQMAEDPGFQMSDSSKAKARLAKTQISNKSMTTMELLGKSKEYRQDWQWQELKIPVEANIEGWRKRKMWKR